MSRQHWVFAYLCQIDRHFAALSMPQRELWWAVLSEEERDEYFSKATEE